MDPVSGVILMFHEVHRDDASYLHALEAGCTASLLDSVIGHLRREQWDIVAIDQALSRLDDRSPGRPFAVLTFDDGYRDTLTSALPVLERSDAPFIVYVPTGAPTRELDSWWLGLRALFQERDAVSIPGMDTRLESGDAASKIAALHMAARWIQGDYSRARHLETTFRAHGISIAGLNDRYFMSERELIELANHPLAAIGCHGTSHAPLSALDTAAARLEMTGNREYLEHLLDRSVLDFAYPYGVCGEREFALAAAAGYRSAVTTRHAPVVAAHRMIPHQLPRVGVEGTTTDFDRFAQYMRRLRISRPEVHSR